MGKIIRVIVVDDSALVRKVLSEGLNKDPEIEVIATANDPFQARDLIKKLDPDILTLDVEMPRMDGVELLRRMMPVRPMPVIMVSSLTERGAQITMDALDAGAIDFVTKPTTGIRSGLEDMIDDLIRKIKVGSRVRVSRPKIRKVIDKDNNTKGLKSLSTTTDKVIAIGASTGGTEAIKEVITKFSADTPGVVIVQHMPAGFTKLFSQRLNGICNMDVKEAEDGDRIMRGRILIAPGGFQMKVIRVGGTYRVKIEKGEPVCGHMPSVEVLFKSVADHVGKNSVGAILTGMGKDGAGGMLSMKEVGAYTIAQDKASSVVYGMPMEALKIGGVTKISPLNNIAEEIVKNLK
ncbi:MAG: chemotaxis response regulator protein-glutamate methylesterase [Candidatus Cloacimonadota bacterium]|nr:MAG: chemotaxis response regulator protein-glutamate methylesterase [Candidatus Cloacimonadota bacterium]PIE77737.1 MAG: chemotaxis response regulator protein-glutamate methylesterase [Candidatus Delongbacteria bacterium]